MIAFFPELYPDELLYSAFCRYLDKSGYGVYRSAAEDIFENSLVKPDRLFLNRLSDELIHILTKQKSIEQIIMDHTMYPDYARFLPTTKREAAFRSLVSMDGNHKNKLQLPKPGNIQDRFLRYCSLCCRHDRDLYGEKYWHRSHQMYGIGVCPIHGCRLENSTVSLDGKASPGFFSAELNTAVDTATPADSPLEIELAEYVADLMARDISDKGVSAAVFLHEMMAGGKYTSPRGEQKKVALLYEDISAFYAEMPENTMDELWKLKKVLDGKVFRVKEIAMIAMFIGVSAKELAEMKMPKEPHKDWFDRRVKELHDQGLKYPRIAEIMGASINVVKPIGEGNFGKYRKGPGANKGGIKARDWDEYDRELLPKVTEAIKVIRNEGGRPGRVTFRSVARYIGMSEKRYPNLPLCREEVKKNYEDWEHYWAREMVFFYERIKLEDKPVTATAIMNMTNARRRNLIRGIPYLEQYTDRETAAAIRELITR